MPASPLSMAELSRNTPRMDFSCAIPHTPFFRTVTWCTTSRSVLEAQIPVFLKPRTVSERMVTSRSRCFPTTQMPLPLFPQAFWDRLPDGVITVLWPAPIRRSRDLLICTLSR